MKKIFQIIVCACLAGIVIFGNLPVPAQAAAVKIGTAVGGTISADVVWTKEGSPYLLSQGVSIVGGHKLTIEPGVTVTKDPRSAFNGPGLNVMGGSLDIRGLPDDRVVFSGIGQLSVDDATATISCMDFRGGGPSLSLFGSDISISSSTISDSTGTGIYVLGSKVRIQNSRIENNATVGVWVVADILTPSSITISNSVIADNGWLAIRNDNASAVKAENNWWGNADGPLVPGSNRISGLVSYVPWLTSEPSSKPAVASCCSNILFLPGLEGTRLYRPESPFLGLIGSGTNRLWEPNWNGDVTKLFMALNGSSSDPTVYSGNPVDKAYGMFGVYDHFMKFLDGLVRVGTINDWKAFGYDWREPIDEIVGTAQKRATTTETLIDAVKDLAMRSGTGKVTLIAHSNGGLVAKYLVKELAEMGWANLVDSVISVAVPYLGTPQAILSLLHGDGQAIGGGLILKQSTARQLAGNMGSAYSLLPAADYFKEILGPTIVFASTTSDKINDGSYAAETRTAADQTAFITDSSRARREPDPYDTKLPIRGNEFLMASAQIIHSVLDPFIWPENILHFSILGWNKETAKGVYYYGLNHSKIATNMGDGTVVSRSAAYGSGTTTSIDLGAVSSVFRDVSHGNILESSTTQTIIGKIVTKDPSFCEEISKLPGAACGEPDYSKEATYLVLSTHSPVELHAYDSKGNHTGIIPTPPESGIGDDVVTFTENKIPGSSFDLSGPDSYIYLPDESKNYSVVIKGAGTGSFDFEIERKRGTDVFDRVTYENIPVTPLSVATATIAIPPIISNEASIPGFASSSSTVNLDIDGNGNADLQVSANQSADPIAALESLKKAILSLLGPTGEADRILSKIDRLEELTRRGSLANAIRSAKRLEKETDRIGHKTPGNLDQAEKDRIASMIESYIGQLEQ